MAKGKPFIKWVGGKTQLIGQLDELLPANFEQMDNVTYIEPFVGGGAMLFYMLQRYPNIRQAIINDINGDLTTCYQTVRDYPEELIASLRDIQEAYNELLTEEGRKDFFMAAKARYNEKNLDPIENTTKFFFLNRTCFNGLYRVNKMGLFNVPFGKYVNPQIYDEETIRLDSELLRRVEILNGDFERTFEYANGNTLFYFDPPYRPLSDTSSFNDYTKESFNDDAQIRLKRFCDRIHEEGFLFMLSNSDCRGKNEEDNFFDVLYADYYIERVWAARYINSNPTKRGKLTEILVHNYNETKQNTNVDDIFNGPYFAAEEINTKMNNTIMEKNFELFLSQLAETNATLESYCDFTKIKKNVHNIEISLNMLNFLLGKEDLRPAVELLWERDKSVFNVLDILIATRRKEKKKFIDTDGQIKIISSLFKSVDGIMQFLNETGLSEVFRNKDIKNLVDYVFGVETGLDTHARKNRGGDITETLLHNILIQNGIPHKTEVGSSYYSQIQTALGDDKKRFDFVIETNKKTYLIEVNFYNGGGSKLNEVARAYRELAPLINNIKGFEFVWITDGKGWIGAKNKLSEAYNDIPKVYNFSTLKIFLEEIKNELNG